ncbi:MAG: YaeQ family protein [Gammaproteobacteria bacterium]|nr:YaeQ family protein [Gammaproteobacteria bacterium]
MALKATIFKAELQVSDLERHYYQSHSLTIARHPSETDLRMMVRILLFALHADDRLSFTRGLSSDDEPDLWATNLSGEIDSWIELGQPDEKRIRKACGRAKQVYIYTYSARGGSVWWEQNREALTRYDNLNVTQLAGEGVKELVLLAARNMKLNCTIQEGEVWLGNAFDTVQVTLKRRRSVA